PDIIKILKLSKSRHYKDTDNIKDPDNIKILTISRSRHYQDPDTKELIGLERFLKLSSLLVGLSLGKIGNLVDNVGMIAFTDWNPFNIISDAA
ncbi:4452_t:CDS:2, partial [Ambispora leptoticha]